MDGNGILFGKSSKMWENPSTLSLNFTYLWTVSDQTDLTHSHLYISLNVAYVGLVEGMSCWWKCVYDVCVV